MAINFSPKVGEILECNFGNYPVSQEWTRVQQRITMYIPPEDDKKWVGCVAQRKIIAATHVSSFHYQAARDHDKLNRGMHVGEIASNVINDYQFFDQQIRWAKADCSTTSQSKPIKQSKDLSGYLNQCFAT